MGGKCIGLVLRLQIGRPTEGVNGNKLFYYYRND